jgi:hypothetical protein
VKRSHNHLGRPMAFGLRMSGYGYLDAGIVRPLIPVTL